MAGAGDKNSILYKPHKHIQDAAHVQSMEQYDKMYKKSVDDPPSFWGEIAEQFHWKVPPKSDKFLQYNFSVDKGPIFIKWMEGAVTNICYNVLDRNVKDLGLADKTAFFWEGNDPEDCKSITYGQLLKEVCKFANVLKSKGIKKGDRVALYMPMIIELVVAMLACARIGAMHSIIFGGFSADSVKDRILDSKAKLVITADASYRGTKLIKLKTIVDDALKLVHKGDHKVDSCIVVQHVSAGEGTKANKNGEEQPAKRPCTSLQVWMCEGRDEWYHELMKDSADTCDVEWMDAEDPLFMLYTSGSTGVPKGVVHTTGGYMLYTATTFKYTFDFHPEDVYWCTADIGWITGHSYVTYGPMLNGATSVIFEGVPFHPDAGRFWDVVDKYSVSIFYTAPTAIRALMKYGDEYVTKYKRTSLRVLGTVGEPINPEAWLWYYNIVGSQRCAIVDTFWQTETGGHAITPLPGCTPVKPGSATLPFFGVVPKLLTEEGTVIEGEGEGYLVFSQPWPGIMRTVYGNQPRFEKTYFSLFHGYYATGDGARRDADGYLFITGRIDDMMNCSGHLLSTAQIESAMVEHPSVAEAAVVSQPHEVKGEVPYAFVTLKNGHTFTPELVKELKNKVREKIGPFATPDKIQEGPGLPKTRSGKIMRRVLRKISRGERNIGDVTTLADSSVVDVLFEKKEGAH